MTFTFDPTPIDDLVTELDGVLDRVYELAHDVATDGQGRARHNDPHKAELSRELLRAQDLARLIQGELSVVYWEFKGQPDPRGPRGELRLAKSEGNDD